MRKNNAQISIVLRDNLKTLMGASAELGSQSALKRRSGIAQATIGRIVSDSGENARIETVAALAGAYGLAAWQLLVPDIVANNPPVLGVASAAEKALYQRIKNDLDELGKLKK